MVWLSHASIGQPLWILEALSGYLRQAENLFQVEIVQQETSCGPPPLVATPCGLFVSGQYAGLFAKTALHRTGIVESGHSLSGIGIGNQM